MSKHRNPSIKSPEVTYATATAFTQGQLSGGAVFAQLKSEYKPTLLAEIIRAYQAGFNQMLNEASSTIHVKTRKSPK